MDKVFIHDLDIKTVIGIYEWEQKIQQTVRVNLEMCWDNKYAANTKSIEDALCYKTVSKAIIADISQRKELLLETLAEDIAQLVLQLYPIPWLRLRLSKPGAVTGAKDVGVEIERTPKDYQLEKNQVTCKG